MFQSLEPVDTIFANHFFTIPDYQRGYAWEERQWNDLLQDLELLPRGKSHFTGTLILQPVDDGKATIKLETGSAGKVQSVIDGQQRLTTIVLLLKAITDEMERLGEPERLVQGIRETYLAVKDRNEQLQTRLRLNRDTQEFFYRNVLGYGPGVGGVLIRSHRLLDRANRHFVNYLQDMGEDLGGAYGGWLDGLFDKVTLHLTMIVYVVDDELDAGVIFETMNDRGKPLTELEKVKNYLLYLASKLDLPDDHDLGERINRTWRHIFESLMTAELSRVEDEDRLLRAHWLMAYEHDPKKWQQSRSIKEVLNLRHYQGRHTELLQEIQNYLQTLHDATTAFCDIHQPGHQSAFNQWANTNIHTEIVTWGKKLARLGPRAVFLPLLMAVRLKSLDEGTMYQRAVELCEKFDFRIYQWKRYRFNTAQSRFFRLANQFFNNPDPDWLERELLKVHHHYCTNEQFIEHFERELENWYAWRGLSYFLYEYEHHLAGGRDVKISWEDLERRKKEKSVEHILPQAPSKPYWKERFSKQDLERWTHDIGNLTITHDNPSLGNKSFPDKRGEAGKKGTYADSSLFIEREIGGQEEWTPSEIEKRREKIKAWAVERWAVEEPPLEETQPDGGIDAIFTRAAECGVEDELQELHELAISYRLHPRAHKRTISYMLPSDWTRSVISIAPHQNTIRIEIRSHNFEKLDGVEELDVVAIMEGEAVLWLPGEQVPEFTLRLHNLLNKANGYEGVEL